ncbi:MAG TPA: hemerythrin domain-containing protein [Actinomycetota bacterium]
MAPGVTTVQEEHQRFVRHLEEILELADAVGTVPLDDLVRRTGEVHGFLARDLMPHAVAEDSILFPALRGGTDDAPTVAMTRCHRQLARFTDELEAQRSRLLAHAPRADVERELRRILYGTHALLSAHFAETDEAFAASLGGTLSVEERERLFERVERYADDVAKLLRFGG